MKPLSLGLTLALPPGYAAVYRAREAGSGTGKWEGNSPMASPKELRQSIVDARADLQAALHGVHQRWESKPAGGEGEDSWSPREVAQHVIGAEWFFTNLVAQACGAPPMERPTIDASSPAMAAASLSRLGGNDDGILRHVSDGDLSKTSQNPRMEGKSVEELLTMLAGHTREHIQQLETGAKS